MQKKMLHKQKKTFLAGIEPLSVLDSGDHHYTPQELHACETII